MTDSHQQKVREVNNIPAGVFFVFQFMSRLSVVYIEMFVQKDRNVFFLPYLLDNVSQPLTFASLWLKEKHIHLFAACGLIFKSQFLRCDLPLFIEPQRSL